MLSVEEINSNRDRFVKIFQNSVTREGSEKLLNYLLKSDFFTAPSSTRFHCSYEGGLCQHSLNVYDCLNDYLKRDYVKNRYNIDPSEETIAVVTLLHDVCKTNTYTVSMRNKKDEQGQWVQVPFYEFNEKFSYGSHGGKSIAIIQEFMKLKLDEQVAINCHMGAYDRLPGDFSLNSAYSQYPLALAVHIADVEASVLIEKD